MDNVNLNEIACLLQELFPEQLAEIAHPRWIPYCRGNKIFSDI
jgi:hypothetical protein